MLKIRNSSFVKSIVNIKEAPQPGLAEFAFAGRSNVGKSSLINSLVNRKNIAKVSKQPGKTRTINYFLINEQFYLVDLPGYGYAKVPGSEKEKWRKMIENYLLNSKNLMMLYVLIDGMVGPQKNDIQLVEWLQYEGIPYYVVETKTDRIKSSRKKAQEQEIVRLLKLPPEIPVIPFSAKTRAGRDELLRHMNHLLKTAGVDGQAL